MSFRRPGNKFGVTYHTATVTHLLKCLLFKEAVKLIGSSELLVCVGSLKTFMDFVKYVTPYHI